MNMQNFEYNTINIQVDLARHFMTVNTNVITLDEVMESKSDKSKCTKRLQSFTFFSKRASQAKMS